MKNLLRLLPLGAFSLCVAAAPAAAQSSFGQGGANPFARLYAAPPSQPQQAATPAPALANGQNPYGAAAGLNPAVAGPSSYEPIDPNHKLGTGDTLSFAVVEDRGDPGPSNVIVNAAGDALVPYIGLVPAAGKTVTQFTSEVKARLEREYFYRATVMMGLSQTAQRQSRGRVYVTGAVRMIGPVELPVDEKLTVSKAVIRAGGMKDVADERRVRVQDKDGKDRGVNVDLKAIRKGKSKGDVALEPGDTIYVPERAFIF